MKVKRVKNRKSRSLRIKMLLWAFLFVVPILFILSTSISAAIRSFETLTSDTIDQILTPYVAEIDTALTVSKRYIANLNLNLTSLLEPDEFQRLQTALSLSQSISKDLSAHPEIDAVFLSFGDELAFIQNYNRDYTDNREAANALRDVLNADDYEVPLFQQGFMYFEAGGRYYLYIAADVQGGAAGCWFCMDVLVNSIWKADPEGLERIILADRQNRMLDVDFDTRSAKQLAQRLEPYFVSSYRLTAAPFEINALWNREIVFAPVAHLQRSVYTTICVALSLFVFYVVFLRASLIRPLNRLVSAINGIRNGNWEHIPVRKNEDTEIAEVYHALNDMTDQIESLRIQMYEEKLLKQKTQLQLFQLQLKPHFFLNALNTIVSFARIKEYGMVQKMTMYLATHCRYILYSPWFVSVDEELVYTQNFVDMQSTQHNMLYRYFVHTAGELLDYEVPILCVQIFVENSLKYSVDSKNSIEIHVSLSEVIKEDVHFLCIEIDDTGNGFADDILKMLNDPEFRIAANEDRGIGIENVRQRLRLLYDGFASLRFANRETGGAHVEICLPVDRVKGGIVH